MKLSRATVLAASIFCTSGTSAKTNVVVVVSNITAPEWAVRWEGQEPLVSCRWLQTSLPDLSCETTSSSITTPEQPEARVWTTTFLSENAEPLEGRDQTGCCAEWARYLRLENGSAEEGRMISGSGPAGLPFFEIATVESFSAGMSVPKRTFAPLTAVKNTTKDSFVPLHDVARAMRMTFEKTPQRVLVSSSIGHQRTLERVLNADTWIAREASHHLKRIAFANALQPKHETPTVLFWASGEVKRLWLYSEGLLEALEIRGGVWVTQYQALVEARDGMLCAPNSPKKLKAGWRFPNDFFKRPTAERGKAPSINTPITKYAICTDHDSAKNRGYATVQVFSQLQTDGREDLRLWLALDKYINYNTLTYEPSVLDKRTGQPTDAPVPTNYAFMREPRQAGR